MDLGGVPTKPKILFVADHSVADDAALESLQTAYEVESVQSSLRALALLSRERYDGVYASAEHLAEAFRLGELIQSERILDGMPDGVALLDSENNIIWANTRLLQWSGKERIIGLNFYATLQSPEILGPDFCPFHTALCTGKPSSSTLRSTENTYYQVQAAPLVEVGHPIQHLVVSVRDVTEQTLQQQKLAAIHRAGIELANLTPEELFQMSVEERVELLKSNILHYTKDLLKYDVVEIRLLNPETGGLEPLLAVGLTSEAEQRDIFAQPQNNGVTGFVAATGKSYLCENTSADPLFLEGAQGAKSSLTVPLLQHDEVIGTFNVESPEPGGFGESDMQFLEIFSRDVANALNTLELLVAEKASSAAQSIEAVHSAVALPVDDILNDAVNLLESYIGHEPQVMQRLRNILRNTRDIKQVIQKVGQKMTPSQAHPQLVQTEERPLLQGRHVLMVDADDSVRGAAHALLERYKCIVETAHDGTEAIGMVRNMEVTGGYDVIIADIHLPDMNGYELFLKLKELLGDPPLVLMTGFGYDPGHTIVKAKKAGVGEVLYKPFRLDQLLETVERIVRSPRGARQSS